MRAKCLLSLLLVLFSLFVRGQIVIDTLPQNGGPSALISSFFSTSSWNIASPIAGAVYQRRPTIARRAAGYGYGPGYYAPRPHYGFGYRPFRYRRAPIIVERRTYVVPRYRYNNRPSYAPNARSGGGYNNGNGYGSSGYRGGGSRGPR